MATSRDPAYPPGAQDDDDLPRTLRRAKQERAAQLGHTASPPPEARPSPAPDALSVPVDDRPLAADREDGVTVRRFDVPFLSLMLFFVKAVLAGIPALILLGGILWAAGVILKLYFPWIIQTEILIRFPG